VNVAPATIGIIVGAVALVVALVVTLVPGRRGATDDPGGKGASSAAGLEQPTVAPAGRPELEPARGGARDDEVKIARLLATARTFKKEGLLERAKESLVEAIAIDGDNQDAARLLREVKDAIAAEEQSVERKREHKKWLDQGFSLQLAGKLEEAAKAYERAAAAAPAGSREAAEKASACWFEHLAGEGKRAAASGDAARAVELYTQALSHKPDGDVARALKDARRRVETQRADAVRRATAKHLKLSPKRVQPRTDVNDALEVAEELANRQLAPDVEALRARQASAMLARLRGLPPEKAAAEARACLTRFIGTPAAAELEKIAFGRKGGGR
jgi:tetratricopeptide (TPR) repeat protein